MKCTMFILDFLKIGQPIPKDKKFGLNVCLIQAASISCLLCSCAVHPPSPYGSRTARECCVHTKCCQLLPGRLLGMSCSSTIKNNNFTKRFSLFISLKNSQQKNVKDMTWRKLQCTNGRKQNNYTIQQQNLPKVELGWRKQHIVPNVSINFVWHSVELVPWWRLVVSGSKHLCLQVLHVLL